MCNQARRHAETSFRHWDHQPVHGDNFLTCSAVPPESTLSSGATLQTEPNIDARSLLKVSVLAMQPRMSHFYSDTLRYTRLQPYILAHSSRWLLRRSTSIYGDDFLNRSSTKSNFAS
jgi:hypothetical protein